MSADNPRLPEPAATPDTIVLPPPAAAISPAPSAATLNFNPAGQAPLPTPTVPGYELLAELGRGGMGVVYKARQKNPQRIVALKCILAGQLASAADVQRFRNEADAAALMSHPGLIPIYEVGEHEGQHYFSMKFIDGGTLADAIAAGQWKGPSKEKQRAAAKLVADVARAVHYAHQCGIIHRDLKPANILLDENGHALVTDFGLAKRFAGNEALTGSNVIIGTPAYMSPEQALGKGGLTTAADVYSLGAIFYELLAGRPPFEGDTPLAVVLQLREQKPKPPRSLVRMLDLDLETICLKCLEKDPRQRYGSAKELAEDLERWLNGDVILARRAGTLEWTWKWVRRHPAQTVMGFLMFLILVLALGGLGMFWRLSDLDEQRKKDAEYAEHEHQANLELQQSKLEAEKNAALAKSALKQVEAALYANGIARAHFEWMANDPNRADQVLDDCPEHLRNWEWYYLKRACHPELLTIESGPSLFPAAAINRDGTLVATTSNDKTVKVWDAHTGEQKFALTGHTDWITSVAFSPDGTHLASSSQDRTVIVWDLTTQKAEHTLMGHTNTVLQVVYSSDGKQLATAGLDQTARIWSAETGIETLTLKKQLIGITSVVFSPDGSRLATASADKTAKIWDLATGMDIQTLRGHTGAVNSVAFNSDGKRVVTGSEDQQVILWDVDKGTPLHVLRVPSGRVYAATFSPDDKLIAAACMDGKVRVWDAANWQQRFVFHGHTAAVGGIAFTGDGKQLVSSSSDLTAKIWDVAVHQESYSIPAGTNDIVIRLAFSPNGRQLAAAAVEGDIKVWDPATGTELFRLPLGSHAFAVAYRSDGKRIATAAEGVAVECAVSIWDVGTRRQIASVPKDPRHQGVSCISYSSDGTKLAIGRADGTVAICDAETGRELAKLDGHGGIASFAVFSPDGKRLVIGSTRNTVTVWDVEKQQELRTFQGHTEGVSGVAIFPDGNRVVSASLDGVVKIWKVDTGETLLALKDRAGRVDCLALSPDGDRLATGSSRESNIKIWDTQTGQETLTLKGHAGSMRCLAFSSDGHLLASGSFDHTVHIWNATPLPPRDSPWLMGPMQREH